MRPLLAILLLLLLPASPPTGRSVYRELVEQEVDFPAVAWRQAMLESDHLRSYLARDHNNILGIKPSRIRESTVIGTSPGGHASYARWEDCVRDYRLRQLHFYRKLGHVPSTEDEYYDWLVETGYAEDKSYVDKLRGIKAPAYVR